MAQNDILAKVSVIINAQTATLGKDLKVATSKIDSFTNGLKTAGKAIVGAFAIRELASFTLDIVKLAGETKGVKAAFDLLPGSIKVLEDLKRATGGTVSELELMKRTVQAANFGISLSALPKLLEFATLRAQQTGQSVDYLVDSIVTGIGRKSPLILDNLGISAVQLKNELGGVSIAAADIGTVAEAVGRIAGENLKSMAGFSENASTKIQQLTASWQDFKAQLGTRANDGGLFLIDIPLDILQKFVDVIKLANSDPVMESFNEQTAVAVDNFKKLDKASQTDAINRLAQDVQRAKNDLEAFNKELSQGINRDGLSTNEALIQLDQMNKGVVSLQDQYKKFIALYKSSNEEVSKSSGIIADLEERLKSLTDGRSAAFTISEIQIFNKKIEETKTKLDSLLKPSVAPTPLKIPIEFDLSRDDQALLDSVGLSGKNVDPLAVVVDFEIPKESTDELDAYIDNFKARGEELRYTLNQIIESGFEDAVYGMADSLGALLAGADKVTSFKDVLLSTFGNMLQSLGKIAIQTGIGVEAIKTALKSLNGVVAIAAGAALVALGSAVKSQVKGLGSSLGGGGGSISSSATRSSSSFSTAAQNSSAVTFQIKGEDLWGTLNNYNRNSRYTNAIGG